MMVYGIFWSPNDDFDGVYSTRENALEYAKLVIQEKLFGLGGAMSDNDHGYQSIRRDLLNVLANLGKYVVELELDANLKTMQSRSLV